MDIGDIISKSFKYPIDDLTNFKFVMIFFLLLVIPIFLVVSNINWRLDIISVILVLIFFLIFPGYNLSVIKKGIDQSKTVPSFNIWKNVLTL